MSGIKYKDPTWFEQVSPGLLRNRAIRNYLGNYASNDWPEVVKLTLLYGLITLHKQSPGKIFTVDQLRNIIATGQVAVTVETAIPGVQSQLDVLQAQLEEITNDVYDPSAHATGALRHTHQVDPPITVTTIPAGSTPLEQSFIFPQPQPAAARPGVAPVQQHRSRTPDAIPAAARVRRRSSPIQAPLPPSHWRTGDDRRTWSPPGRKRSPVRSPRDDTPHGAVYPTWWGDGSSNPAAKPKQLREPDHQPRPPPRLAYPVQQDQVPLYLDDLVTSRYLDVPSSGYGQQLRASQDHDTPTAHISQADAAGHPFQLPHPQEPAAQAAGWGNAGHGQAWPVEGHHAAHAMQQAYHQPAVQHQAVQPQQLYMMAPSGALLPVAVMQHQAQQLYQPQQQHPQPNQHQQQQQQQRQRKVNLKTVESKIKQQVHQDREAAKLKLKARDAALHQALRRPALRSDVQGTATAPTQAPVRPAHPAVSDIADSLASNPWTSWFVSDAQSVGTTPQHPAAGPTQHQQQQSPAAAASAAMTPAYMFHTSYAAMPAQSSHPPPDNYGAAVYGNVPGAALYGSAGGPGRPSTSNMGGGAGLYGGAYGTGGDDSYRPPSSMTSSTAAMAGPPPAYGVRPQGLKWDVPIERSPPKAQKGMRPEVAKLVGGWVGDYGHLDYVPRFDWDQAVKPRPAYPTSAPANALSQQLAELTLQPGELRANFATASMAVPHMSAPPQATTSAPPYTAGSHLAYQGGAVGSVSSYSASAPTHSNAASPSSMQWTTSPGAATASSGHASTLGAATTANAANASPGRPAPAAVGASYDTHLLSSFMSLPAQLQTVQAAGREPLSAQDPLANLRPYSSHDTAQPGLLEQSSSVRPVITTGMHLRPGSQPTYSSAGASDAGSTGSGTSTGSSSGSDASMASSTAGGPSSVTISLGSTSNASSVPTDELVKAAINRISTLSSASDLSELASLSSRNLAGHRPGTPSSPTRVRIGAGPSGGWQGAIGSPGRAVGPGSSDTGGLRPGTPGSPSPGAGGLARPFGGWTGATGVSASPSTAMGSPRWGATSVTISTIGGSPMPATPGGSVFGEPTSAAERAFYSTVRQSMAVHGSPTTAAPSTYSMTPGMMSDDGQWDLQDVLPRD